MSVNFKPVVWTPEIYQLSPEEQAQKEACQRDRTCVGTFVGNLKEIDEEKPKPTPFCVFAIPKQDCFEFRATLLDEHVLCALKAVPYKVHKISTGFIGKRPVLIGPLNYFGNPTYSMKLTLMHLDSERPGLFHRYAGEPCVPKVTLESIHVIPLGDDPFRHVIFCVYKYFQEFAGRLELMPIGISCFKLYSLGFRTGDPTLDARIEKDPDTRTHAVMYLPEESIAAWSALVEPQEDSDISSPPLTDSLAQSASSTS